MPMICSKGQSLSRGLVSRYKSIRIRPVFEGLDLEVDNIADANGAHLGCWIRNRQGEEFQEDLRGEDVPVLVGCYVLRIEDAKRIGFHIFALDIPVDVQPN